MNKLLEKIYYSPENPASFSGAYKLYNEAKKYNSSIKLNEVKDWLRTQHVYTLHRPARRRWQRNRIYVSYIDEQWEIDLIDLRVYSRQNDGYNYILMVIDVFSKYLY